MFSDKSLSLSLKIAGIYNLLWGIVVILFPLEFFTIAGMEPPNYPELWQCVGMIVGVYGVGYLIAANDFRTHWPIVLVGLLGKILGPLGMLNAIWQGRFPLKLFYICIFNDIIWWIPFGFMLQRAFEYQRMKVDL